MHKLKPIIIDLVLLLIITVPAFIRILNNQYFSMHDDQHIARLFLLDQGLKQGYLYPRWVDGLGFGFGYPLYNFYPPLIYFVGEFFHILGFSLIWSIKLIIVTGFYLGAVGIYLFVKKFTNRVSGMLSATLYTYFFYHAVLIYVRGALAEFFSLAILPFVFLALENLTYKTNLRNGIFFGISIALLILSHPLIALPALLFIGLFFLYNFVKSRFNSRFIYFFIFSVLLGFSLSAFFWLPSMVERKFTLTEKILTGELASYRLHYIYPQQFIYSPWGYGGSGAGLADGVTFQLGKINIGLALMSLIFGILYFLRKKRSDSSFYFYQLTIILLFFSLFMTTEDSSFIWDRVKYLWYLQFPWRFLTFTAIFISIAGGYSVFFLFRLIEQYFQPQRLEILSRRSIYHFFVAVLVIGTIFTYQKYFKPQRYFQTNDRERTSFKEISWRISRTSYEFVPKDVKTTKSELNTTILSIKKENLPKKPYEIISGDGVVSIINNKYKEKEFFIEAKTPLSFRLNTYNFPGWKAYLNGQKVKSEDNNDFKLITISIPSGKQTIKFIFENTPVRNIANFISLVTIGFLVTLNLFQHLNLNKKQILKPRQTR
ncbi:hypothetical protein A2954_07065 [Candidatus Roizmanbacteria bacterium RIFCSPLOWO2_01_FULL_37_12]|uniref:Membrane protein 6-pyruvoyl-tetrahydropterin synthase-related domain-containing protein n=1 Tax=Candidatus Roizmanbacteria bacterium RIFCSPLOWO2_01_FULL_37_12 TaxID=1802056 RepID=A0A1F7IE34_9BACT|nr:MAG: hypothetical protein A3D76_02370 [Candidatus Roizmanbacteria bacterium RIFCSPHIGHO2_02_FULL_37_9b]OGK41612.1 MAG: hypothetical protein A2954_07065 [Candidatus Roizmanbacteria bacterium RIFCSPLOWO2_01_FULL_37_12]